MIVILILNPSEMLKKARDSQRLADFNTIKTAIGLYLANTNTQYLGLNGTSNIGCTPGTKYIWYSKSGVSTAGATLDGSSGQATSTALQSAVGKTDGTGWVPVNLSSLNGGTPISNWPVDPVNSVVSSTAPKNTDLVYRYACSTSSMQFEVAGVLESNAYTVVDNKMANDGGNNSLYYEYGTNLTLLGQGTDF